MKVLFLCMNVSGLHGSALHIMEYAKFFQNISDDISIGAFFISKKAKDLAVKENFKLYKINDVPVDVEYDIVYSLHVFLFPYLLFKGLVYKHAIHALLSVKSPIEQLPPSCMYPYFDLITVISPEIASRYYDEFQLNPNLFMLIPNPIPLNFIGKSSDKLSWNKKIYKLAVVSNHKLTELIAMAKKAPWKTDFFGMEYGNSVSITPELLLEYDAIITIGKTVQYGLGMGIPVFEYDHNGGCGWITLQNFETEILTNFSGRSTYIKRDAESLIKEIEDGYVNAVAQYPKLREMALDKFSIIKLIKKQLKVIYALPARSKPILSPDAWFYCNTCYLALEYMLGMEKNNDI